MNSLKARPGLVYVAVLVLLVVSIPMLRAERHSQSLQAWPAGISQPHRGFSG
ncbi:hypothetical protein ACRQ1B_23085 [Rhizobium panacihumi]|uniref:hypothetical protein n=1 Tax=Rhizobium panacihumi TaxID=2008450 RepID=UPI003D793FF9